MEYYREIKAMTSGRLDAGILASVQALRALILAWLLGLLP